MKKIVNPNAKQNLETVWYQKSNLRFRTQETLGIYIRQSDIRQVTRNKVSRELQSEDFVNRALELGWTENLISTYDDSGKSGVLSIEDREYLEQLISHIKSGKIKTVLIYMVDRLFRDQFLTQASQFAEAAAKNNVTLITYYGQVYDFTEPRDLEDFLEECQRAYRQYYSQIIQRMIGHKRVLADSGGYDGRSLPYGLIRDPQNKKIKIYEPHAEIIRQAYNRYKELGFNMNRLCAEFDGTLFPPVPDDLKHLFNYHVVNPRPDGAIEWKRSSIIGALQNPLYTGIWPTSDGFIEGNHDAIIERELFDIVFERASPKTLFGEAKDGRRRVFGHKGTDCPLILTEVIESEEPGMYVSRQPAGGRWYYKLFDGSDQLRRKQIANVRADLIENVVVDRLFELLANEEKFDDFRSRIATAKAAETKANEKKQARIKEIDQILTVSLHNLMTVKLSKSDADAITAAREELQREKIQIEQEIQTQPDSKKLEQIVETREAFARTRRVWHKLDLGNRMSFIKLIVPKVGIRKLSPRFYQIICHWEITEGPEEILVFLRRGDSPRWTPEDEAHLRSYYPDRLMLEQLMPGRSWSSMKTRAYEIGVGTARAGRDISIPDMLTRQDWSVAHEYGVKVEEIGNGEIEVCVLTQASISLILTSLFTDKLIGVTKSYKC